MSDDKKPMNPTVFFLEANMYDPRKPGRQTYVRAIGDGPGEGLGGTSQVELSRDAVGVVIRTEQDGVVNEHVVPWTNIMQTVNVKPSATAKK